VALKPHLRNVVTQCWFEEYKIPLPDWTTNQQQQPPAAAARSMVFHILVLLQQRQAD